MKQKSKAKKKRAFKKGLKVNIRHVIALAVFFLFVAMVFVISAYHSPVPKKPASGPKTKANVVKKVAVPKAIPIMQLQKPAPNPNLKVPILMFHHIRDPKPIKDPIQHNLSVSPAKFKADLSWLKAHNYQAVTIDDLPAILNGQIKMAKKPVAITFDDGYEDNFTEAFPDLIAAGMTGNFNIITGAIGMPGYMSSEQLKTMEKAGMEFGSHTVRHLDLATLSPDRQTKELADSKTTLGKLLGREITSLCYPSGEYNVLTLAIAKQLGYRLATTTKFGYADAQSKLLELPRVRMTETSNFDALLNR